jgi:hypothetical protein
MIPVPAAVQHIDRGRGRLRRQDVVQITRAHDVLT